jgi:hypothetical protein
MELRSVPTGEPELEGKLANFATLEDNPTEKRRQRAASALAYATTSCLRRQADQGESCSGSSTSPSYRHTSSSVGTARRTAANRHPPALVRRSGGSTKKVTENVSHSGSDSHGPMLNSMGAEEDA